MELKLTNKKLATILLGLGCLLAIVSIFCFFGSAFKIVMDDGSIHEFVNGPSMFVAMFGGMYTVVIGGEEYPFGPIEADAGMITLFVFALLALLVAVIIAVGFFSKKIKPNFITILTVAMCVFLLVAVIMSFCTLHILDIAGDPDPLTGAVDKLGSGAISYSVLGLIALLSSVGGVILSKKAA
ncbi:MAG: hypothetical protein MJ207_01795 [Bacilli bacterium]|nr:hypothetical protein [Bacilli bacterium]